jgi:dUTP pyrophosphatase
MINIEYKGEGKIHAPTYFGDVGNDLELIENFTIGAGETQMIDFGVSVDIPSGYWAMIALRSSTSKNKLIANLGIIDERYRGTLKLVCYNSSNCQSIFLKGTKIAQLIVMPRVDVRFMKERGTNGFGSTN